VNAASRTDQSPEGQVSSGGASRRTFLKGVGLAGAAGLAAPLLARNTARASTVGIILGGNAPGTWNPPSPTPGWASEVPGAMGCRSYRDDVITVPSAVPTTFPGVPGSKVVASIRPHPDVFLNGTTLDDAIRAMIADGNAHFSAPQLTSWHEAGNLYKSGTDSNGVPYSSYLTPSKVRSTHVKLQSLCHEVAGTNVGYGCIIYGDISKMASDTDSNLNWVPTSSYPLDWYGVDVYYEGDGPDSDCTHPPLATYDLVSQYMDGFLSMARSRSGLTWPKINVCECNADVSDDGSRPQFFENLAQWLYNNGGRRMLTFFPDPAGPHSVSWDYAVDAAVPYTINALNYIQSTYG
jgi:hypothetical protein